MTVAGGKCLESQKDSAHMAGESKHSQLNTIEKETKEGKTDDMNCVNDQEPSDIVTAVMMSSQRMPDINRIEFRRRIGKLFYHVRLMCQWFILFKLFYIKQNFALILIY